MQTNIIYNRDCLDFMKEIPSDSIDCIFADLPFYQEEQEELNETGKEKKIKNYKIWNLKLIPEFFRITKSGGNLILVNAPQYIYQTIGNYLELFKFRNSIPLIRKGSLRPAWQLGFQHNLMLFLYKENKKDKWSGATTNHDKSYPTDIWTDIPYQNGYRATGNQWHPEAINYPIVERAILLNSKENDLIYDPCIGSGTSALACIKNNRRYIGTEINHHYWQIATNRLYSEASPLF